MEVVSLLLRPYHAWHRDAFLAALSLVFGALAPAAAAQEILPDSESSFFRLKSSYRHAGEIVSFDIVAVCNLRVTTYGDSSSSHDLMMAPPFFATRTKDGGVIAQKVPNACGGETTANGRVPKDLLPGAIWFDDASDLSLGIAYILEESFASPKSKLEFLGATISAATKDDWEEFYKTIPQSVIPIDRYYKFGKVDRNLSEAELMENPWDRKALTMYHGYGVLGCGGYQRFRFTKDEERAQIRALWPSSRPRYWALSPSEGSKFAELTAAIRDFATDTITIRRSAFSVDHIGLWGFPTRAGGGVIGQSRKYPEIFADRESDGIPWLDKSIIGSDHITVGVDVQQNLGPNFVYCYSGLTGLSPIVQNLIPEFKRLPRRLRVDGVPVEIDGKDQFPGFIPPAVFFDRDEFAFVRFGFY
ncbi:MAG: hypothetical protein HYU58_08170 [Proteobacteria bacterium]|nr:hypothetical protein [Pseudomonadota bacterium]